AGRPSSEIFLRSCPWKSRRCHDPRRAAGASQDARTPRRRGEARRRGSCHAALGPRRARGLLSGPARDDPRPRHAAAPPVREVLRLRAGSVPRTAGCPAARRGRDGGRAPSGRGGHGGRRLGTHHDRCAGAHAGGRGCRGGADLADRRAPRCVRRLRPLAAGAASRVVTRPSVGEIMTLFYGWIIVAAGVVVTCIGLGAMLSLSIFLQPMSAATGWSRTGISTAALLHWV